MESQKRKSRMPVRGAYMGREQTMSKPAPAKRGRGGGLSSRGASNSGRPAFRPPVPKPRAIRDAFDEQEGIPMGSVDNLDEEEEDVDVEGEEGMDDEPEQESDGLDYDYDGQGSGSAAAGVPLPASVQRSSETKFRTPTSVSGRQLGRPAVQPAVAPGASAAQRLKQRQRDEKDMELIMMEKEKWKTECENLRLQLQVLFPRGLLCVHSTGWSMFAEYEEVHCQQSPSGICMCLHHFA